MALFVLSLCPFDISVGVGAFVIGLSQISSFFSESTSSVSVRSNNVQIKTETITISQVSNIDFLDDTVNESIDDILSEINEGSYDMSIVMTEK